MAKLVLMSSQSPIGVNEDSLEAPRVDQSSEVPYESTLSRINTQKIEEAVEESAALTGVGIIFKDKKGIKKTIDEALWDKSPTLSTAKFPLLVSWTDQNNTMQLTVRSRFLMSAIMGVLPRTNPMGIRKRHNSLTFDDPFIQLYWFYDKIVKAASDPGSLNEDNSRDLDVLRRWYERVLLEQHLDIRNNIDSGHVTFDLLWALFQPNDIVYTRDHFQQPQLLIVSLTQYREALNSPVSVSRPRRFQLKLLYQDWDSSAQVFGTMVTRMEIEFYTGSRHITDLAVYPLQFYAEGRKDLLAVLNARGIRWKSLVTQSSYMIHKGPAIQLDGDTSGTRKHVSPNSLKHGRER